MVAVCQLLAFAIYLGGIMATLGLLNNHEEDKNHFCFSLLLFFFPPRYHSVPGRASPASHLGTEAERFPGGRFTWAK